MESGVIEPSRHREVQGLLAGDIPTHTNKIVHQLRFAFTTTILFSIENMLVNILAKRNKQKIPRGFNKIATALIDDITDSDKDDKKRTLDTLAHIRNSAHSNGIHNNADFDAVVAGYRFSFKKGREVTDAGWGQIALVVKATISILVKIIHSPEVQSIPAPIPIAYIEK